MHRSDGHALCLVRAGRLELDVPAPRRGQGGLHAVVKQVLGPHQDGDLARPVAGGDELRDPLGHGGALLHDRRVDVVDGLRARHEGDRAGLALRVVGGAARHERVGRLPDLLRGAVVEAEDARPAAHFQPRGQERRAGLEDALVAVAGDEHVVLALRGQRAQEPQLGRPEVLRLVSHDVRVRALAGLVQHAREAPAHARPRGEPFLVQQLVQAVEHGPEPLPRGRPEGRDARGSLGHPVRREVADAVRVDDHVPLGFRERQRLPAAARFVPGPPQQLVEPGALQRLEGPRRAVVVAAHGHLVEVDDVDPRSGFGLQAHQRVHLLLQTLGQRLGERREQHLPAPLAGQPGRAVHGHDGLARARAAAHAGGAAMAAVHRVLLGGVEEDLPVLPRLGEGTAQRVVVDVQYAEAAPGVRVVEGVAAGDLGREFRRATGRDLEEVLTSLFWELLAELAEERLLGGVAHERAPCLRHAELPEARVRQVLEGATAEAFLGRLGLLVDDLALDHLDGLLVDDHELGRSRVLVHLQPVALRPPVGVVVVADVAQDGVLPLNAEDEPDVVVHPHGVGVRGRAAELLEVLAGCVDAAMQLHD